MVLTGTLSLKDLNLSGTLSSDGEVSGNINSVIGVNGGISNTMLRGYSAYEIAVQHGFIGTEEEWLASLSVEQATDTRFGIVKLYNETGQNTDGTMTQRSITNAITDNSAEGIPTEDLLEILN